MENWNSGGELVVRCMHGLCKQTNKNERKTVVFTTCNKIWAFLRFLVLFYDDVIMTQFCRVAGTDDDMVDDVFDDVVVGW